MDFEEIIGRIPVIELYNSQYILPENLQQKTEFVEMARFTSSTNPIATWGIGPCLGIGISYYSKNTPPPRLNNWSEKKTFNSHEGINYLEHATPTSMERTILHINQVILKFIEHKQTPNVYLFRTKLGPEISAVIYKLNNLGLVESGNVFFCNITNIFLTDYVGIYNNKPFYFQKRIENPSFNNSKNYLNFNFSNTNVQKAKQFSVGDYVMIPNSPDTYVIFRIKSNNSKIHLYNLSIPDSSNSFKIVSPDQLVKKRSYSNTVRGRTTYPIPDDIQNIINKSKNK
jgi:hypothetical protein